MFGGGNFSRTAITFHWVHHHDRDIQHSPHVLPFSMLLSLDKADKCSYESWRASGMLFTDYEIQMLRVCVASHDNFVLLFWEYNRSILGSIKRKTTD